MPSAKRSATRSAEGKSRVVSSRRRAAVPPPEVPVDEETFRPEEEAKQDLGTLMAQSIDHRNRASQALARLRSLHLTVLDAAVAGKADIEQKMATALEEYRSARFSALRARRQLLASLSSNETC